MALHQKPTLADALAVYDYEPDTGVLRWSVDRRSGYGRIVARAGERAGSIDVKTGYVVVSLCGRSYRAHQIAWLIGCGRWAPNQIDHINGDKADNRLCNLREATARQNLQNQRKATGNNKHSGLIGAHKTASGWVSRIRVEGRTKILGYFADPLAAHRAYIEAKRKYHDFNTL